MVEVGKRVGGHSNEADSDSASEGGREIQYLLAAGQKITHAIRTSAESIPLACAGRISELLLSLGERAVSSVQHGATPLNEACIVGTFCISVAGDLVFQDMFSPEGRQYVTDLVGCLSSDYKDTIVVIPPRGWRKLRVPKCIRKEKGLSFVGSSVLEVAGDSVRFVSLTATSSSQPLPLEKEDPSFEPSSVNVTGQVQTISAVVKSTSRCGDDKKEDKNHCGMCFLVRVQPADGGAVVLIWCPAGQSMRFRYLLQIGQAFQFSHLKRVTITLSSRNALEVLSCTHATSLAPMDQSAARPLISGTVCSVDRGVITLTSGVRLSLHLHGKWSRTGWALRPGSGVSV